MSYLPIATGNGQRWAKVLAEFTHVIGLQPYDFIVVDDEGSMSVTHRQSGKRYALLPAGIANELILAEAHKAIDEGIERHGVVKIRRVLDHEPPMETEL